MNKSEAIREFVKREFQGVPTSWVQIVSEHYGECNQLPMWGTMWIVDNLLGEQLWKLSAVEGDDVELAGERRLADTAMFVYEVDDAYVVGIHGAGWDFYDGVWDRVYDAVGLRWHE